MVISDIAETPVHIDERMRKHFLSERTDICKQSRLTLDMGGGKGENEPAVGAVSGR